MNKTLGFGLFMIVSVGFGQIDSRGIIKESSVNPLPQNKITKYRAVTIDVQRLALLLKSVGDRELVSSSDLVIELPLPDGRVRHYSVVKNNTMSPELAAKYPQISTYDGYGVENPDEVVKLDVTPNGFHAMILNPGKSTIYIDPLSLQDTTKYMVYDRRHTVAPNHEMRCEGPIRHSKPQLETLATPSAVYTACHLRKYRLAVGTTIEYTNFFGSRTKALSQVVTTMNRVNGIYEKDIGVTMELVPNEDLLISRAADGNDGYTHGNADKLIDENGIKINKTIGFNQYDIGHVFDTAGSGLAGLGVVCYDGDLITKAAGVTGIATPKGDSFDVDYVAHEIGHQFGAEHTQNNDCNRWGPSAMEPGSGSTIMSYAGICSPNVQPHSDAYFHGRSLQEIGNFLTSGGGDDCGVKTPIGDAPTITKPANIVVPHSTPFSLKASASGAGLTGFTYGWEQMDPQYIGNQTPKASQTKGPNFRSLTPSLRSTRYLPSLKNLANNNLLWEVVPSVDRVLHFRITVRRNQANGSCTAYRDMTVNVNTAAGPFKVSFPSNAGIVWDVGAKRTVTWSVANTQLAPVNADKVDILLSVDGGLTYPTLLAQGVANDGKQTITVPNKVTNKARIMVRSANRTFFDISNNNFTIQ